MEEIEKEKEIFCNRCERSLFLCKGQDTGIENFNSGLKNCSITGGYFSTPGNGDGALDDDNIYTFSLCEFCLDWLFGTFKIPVLVQWISTGETITWRSAERRILEDDWRKDKKSFFINRLLPKLVCFK